MILSTGLSFACRSINSDSDLKWAHMQSDRAISTINARLQLLELGFKADFKDISVCIQNSATYDAPSLLLETKLAYAAWLEAGGQGNDENWARLKFESKASCNMQDVNYSSIVVISEEARITPDQEISKTFSKNSLTCKRLGMSANCSTGSMTMGLGGPGSIGYRYFKPETWTSVSNRSPSTVLLSPYVNWISLEKEMSKAGLGELYTSLRSKGETVTYAELKDLVLKMSELKMVAKEDGRLDEVVKAFLASKKPSSIEPYVPTLPGYHVLLHEVGHQFGMNHADNPGADSETGPSAGAKQDENGNWTTELSTMAYADDYYYLTEDDRAGILDLVTKSRAFIESHR